MLIKTKVLCKTKLIRPAHKGNPSKKNILVCCIIKTRRNTVETDKRTYASLKRLQFRELLAKVKALGEVTINAKPKYLGDQIPITGDSELSYD